MTRTRSFENISRENEAFVRYAHGRTWDQCCILFAGLRNQRTSWRLSRYTSVFLLQAMRDNKEEIATYERMRKENSCTVRVITENTPYFNEAFFVGVVGMGMMVKSISSKKTLHTSAVARRRQHGHAYTTHTSHECSQELDENTINVKHEKDVF